MSVSPKRPTQVERYVTEQEGVIDALRVRHEALTRDLADLEWKMAEARQILQHLKGYRATSPSPNGSQPEREPVVHAPSPVVKPKPKTGRVKAMTRDDYLAAVDLQEDEEFTARDIAETCGVTTKAAGMMMRALVDDKIIRVTRPSTVVGGSNGRTPNYYRKLRPPV